MRSHVIAAAAVILVLGTVVPAASDETVTTISATVYGSDTKKPMDFTCTVESDGAMLGSFVSTQAGLTVQRQLKSIAVTCSRQGYEAVKFAYRGDTLPAVIAPGFSAKAI